jgi:hypothetical protein
MTAHRVAFKLTAEGIRKNHMTYACKYCKQGDRLYTCKECISQFHSICGPYMFMNMPSDHRFVSSVDGHVAETIELLAEQRESHNNVHEDLWLWVKSGGFSYVGKTLCLPYQGDY